MGKKRIGKKRLTALLDAAAKKYEVPEFLTEDPSCFMHKVEGQSNQELMGFIASVFSYGNRRLFLIFLPDNSILGCEVELSAAMCPMRRVVFIASTSGIMYANSWRDFMRSCMNMERWVSLCGNVPQQDCKPLRR